MGTFKFYAVLIYVLVFIATSAASITHGVNNAEYFFVVMGILNLIAGGWGAYNVWRSENPKR